MKMSLNKIILSPEKFARVCVESFKRVKSSVKCARKWYCSSRRFDIVIDLDRGEYKINKDSREQE